MGGGKLTAKLMEAVPVCFMVDGKEVKRYMNIEIPNEIKHLPFSDFKFDVPANEAITFKIMFEAGVLPETWPEKRQREPRRGQQAALISAHIESSTLEIAFNITGERRKELVNAIGAFYGVTPVYQNAPTFAYRIGDYMVSKNGTLSGPNDAMLKFHLQSKGFV